MAMMAPVASQTTALARSLFSLDIARIL
jgi:hypothetical protein